MFTAALLPLLVFSLLSFIPMAEGLIPEFDSDDPEPEPNTRDIGPIGDEDAPVAPDPKEDVRDDSAAADDPTPVEADDDRPEGATLINMTDGDGETSRIVLTEDDQSGDDPVEVDGTEARDVIEASNDPTIAVQLNSQGGDDTIAFGFSSSADGGAGSDNLELTITEDALADGNLEFGTVVFDDADDVLTIEIEDEVAGFLHEVRILSTQEPDAETEEDTETIFYILNQSDTLSVDEEASLRAGEIVFEDGAQVLAQIDLGTEVVTMGLDENGQPTEMITGAINDTPMILLNRAVASQLSFTVTV